MTELPKRVHPRLRGYDYSRSGVYFLTLCTQNRLPILSEIVGRGIPDAPYKETGAISPPVSLRSTAPSSEGAKENTPAKASL